MRDALKTIAFAAVYLNTGIEHLPRAGELLGSGSWLLWCGMPRADRDAVRDVAGVAIRLWGWKTDLRGEPGAHVGPTMTRFGQTGCIIRSDEWRLISKQELLDDQQSLGAAYDRTRQAAEQALGRLPTTAPPGTPSPIREAYEAVAAALVESLRVLNQLPRYRAASPSGRH